jgi:hypothetical protein
MQEIFQTSLRTDHPQEELRLILVYAEEWVQMDLEMHNLENRAPVGTLVRRLTLPLSLWPRFQEAVCCLGAWMKPLPAPAYQATACCSYTCPPTPEPVVLIKTTQELIHLCLQDRRGSTFLEIKAIQPSTAEPQAVDAQTICIGPTLWTAFLSALQLVDKIISDL